ncbi:MAG: response regulator, partial [Polyangiaceae bacterium]
MSQSPALRILIVDDNDSLLRASQRLCEREGWIVTTAKDGLEAKEKVRAAPFDVIVSDINMPGYGGLEFLRSVREQDLDVPVILVTGKPSVESSMRALEYGAFRYLVKPVPHDKLRDVVQQATRLHELARLKRQAMQLPGSDEHRLREGAALEIRFARCLELMWMAFQPIVSWKGRTIFGNEAL